MRRTALLLHASSYVTWTYQTHTFSNSIESVLVGTTLVLMNNVHKDGCYGANILLGIVAALGTFSRITFPTFILPATALFIVPLLWQRPTKLIAPGLAFLVTCIASIYADTVYYAPHTLEPSSIIITPLNNLIYNASNRNLATHGLHPLYTHLTLNLPSLLGPALLIPFFAIMDKGLSVVTTLRRDLPFLSALSGILFLSCKPHQEFRFLIPAIPLILSSFAQFTIRRLRLWINLWICFNAIAGVFMGLIHQCGVVPSTQYLADRFHEPRITTCGSSEPLSIPSESLTRVLWWRTYPCPEWLFGHDLARDHATQIYVKSLGGSLERLERELDDCVTVDARNATLDFRGLCDAWATSNGDDTGLLQRTFLVAPRSALVLDAITANEPFSPVSVSRSFMSVYNNPSLSTIQPSSLSMRPGASISSFTTATIPDSRSLRNNPSHKPQMGEAHQLSALDKFVLYPMETIDYHINLDDVDAQTEGLVDTVRRVALRHGLGIWLVAHRYTVE